MNSDITHAPTDMSKRLPSALTDDYVPPYNRAGRWLLKGDWSFNGTPLDERDLRIVRPDNSVIELTSRRHTDRQWFETGTYPIYSVNDGQHVVLAEYSKSDHVYAYHLRYAGKLQTPVYESKTEPADERIRTRLGLDGGDT